MISANQRAVRYSILKAHDQATIIAVFNACFRKSEHTLLVGGAVEPWYKAAKDCEPARLYCRDDYPASALHEAAHWCLASRRQRDQDDFGFTYIAPPRNRDQQSRFFSLELPVQSLERLFAQVSGIPFQVSADTFDPTHDDLIAAFSAAVVDYEPRTRAWLQTGPGARAARLMHALQVARGDLWNT